jgi:Leucine-rich repeat (LRR) protein
MKSNVQLILIVFILMSITSACQQQSKYDREVKVEYTPRHINLIRPIVEPERIYQMFIEDKRFHSLPQEMKKMRNLREFKLRNVKIKDWSSSEEVINSFTKLRELEIPTNEFRMLPFNPGSFPHLNKLNLTMTSGYNLDKEFYKIVELDSLKTLFLGGIKTDHLPEKLTLLKNLKRFDFGYHGDNFDYEEAIDKLSKIPELEHIEFDIVTFDTIPQNFHQLHKLKKLSFYDGKFDMSALLNYIVKWEKLEMLKFFDMDVRSLPENITELNNLKALKLPDNPNLDHQTLFRQLAKLPKLEELDISETILHQQYDRFVMPEELAELKNLKRLDMATSQHLVLDSLFDVLARLPKLEYLNMRHNSGTNFLCQLPDKLYKLKNLKTLNISRCGPFPLNNVTKLPPKLRKLNYSTARFDERTPIQKVIFTATSLKSLNLNSCRLKNLPEEIGNLKNLVHLDLGNNQLKDLPESITKLKKLRYLNLMGTHIAESKEKRKEIEQMLPNTLIFFGEYEAYEPI